MSHRESDTQPFIQSQSRQSSTQQDAQIILDDFWMTCGSICSTLGSYDQAIYNFKYSLKFNPGNYRSIYSLGKIYCILYRDEECKDVINSLYNYKYTYAYNVVKGSMLLNMNELRLAYDCFREAMNLQHKLDSFFLYGLGQLHELMGRYEEANTLYLRHLKKFVFYELHTDLLFRIACVNIKLSNYNRVFQILNALCDNNEQSTDRILGLPEVRVLLAYTWYCSGNPDEAYNNLNKLQENARNYYFAVVLKAQLDYNRSDYRAVLGAGTNHPFVSYLKGRVYFLNGNVEDAFKHYRQAILDDKANALFWNSIGVLYMGNRQYEEAIDKFKKAFTLDRSVWQAKFNLCVALESNGTCIETLNIHYTDLCEHVKDPFILERIYDTTTSTYNNVVECIESPPKLENTPYFDARCFWGQHFSRNNISIDIKMDIAELISRAKQY